MNAHVERRPLAGGLFRWLLNVFGLIGSAHKVNEERPYDSYMRWGIRRMLADPYGGEVALSDKEKAKQRFLIMHGESYWFNKACRRLTFQWRICDDRRSLKLHLGIPLMCMHYVTLRWRHDVWFARFLRGKYSSDLIYGLSITKESISWEWAQDSMAWSSDGSTGFHWIYLWDNLLERAQKIEQFSFTTTAKFTMPGRGSRPASEHVMEVTYRQTFWHYRRWWNRRNNHTTYYADINFSNPNKPPAFSGKGENSWDCGDDGIWGCSIAIPPALGIAFAEIRHKAERQAIIDAAIAGYIEKVQQNRQRYG